MAKGNLPAMPDEVLISKIYLLRGLKVMLDKDLAGLYDIKPIRLREQVKRNQTRFPSNFMFQLTEEEVGIMVSQNAIPSRQQLGGALPFAFTEYGVLMLANVLKSERAIQASVRIIEVFVRLREMLLTHKDILLKLDQMEQQVIHNSEDIAMIFEALRQLLNSPSTPSKRVGFRRKDERL